MILFLHCCIAVVFIGEVYKTKRGRTFCGTVDGSLIPGLTIQLQMSSVSHHQTSNTNFDKYNSGGKVGGADKAADEEGFGEAVAIDDVEAVCQDAVRE